ncbi:MAG: hypothetical protein ACQETH_09210 [Candidatus Rifleibacteriota bacterium]
MTLVKKTRFKIRSGFTMVEIIIVSILLALFTGMFFSYFLQKSDSETRLVDRIVINQEGTKSANLLIDHIRESLEVIRPAMGETATFLVTRNSVNEVNVLYCQPEKGVNSGDRDEALYRLVSLTRRSGAGFLSEKEKNFLIGSRSKSGLNTEKVLIKSLKRLTFTVTNPNQVKFNMVLKSGDGEFAFATQVKLLPFGGIE